jgi:hypothetical protein
MLSAVVSLLILETLVSQCSPDRISDTRVGRERHVDTPHSCMPQLTRGRISSILFIPKLESLCLAL